ncbi:MAG: hypothetical protein QM831_01245 [Kofleriaceae bacterium]
MARARWSDRVGPSPEIFVTASARGLAVMFAIGLVLLIVFAVAEHGHEANPNGPLIPAAKLANVTTLYWNNPPLGLVRDGSGWSERTNGATPVPIASRAVEDILDGLRAARAHRIAPVEVAGTQRRQLTIFDGTQPFDVSIGEPLAGTDQQWLVVDGKAALVDGWLARELDPDPIAFRDREPFASAANAQHVQFREADRYIELHANPWRLSGSVVAPARMAAVMKAVANLKLVAVSTAAASGASLQLDAVAATIGGPCDRGPPPAGTTPASPTTPANPTATLIDLAGAHACVANDAWHAVEDAFAFGEPATWIDPRPAGFAIDRIAIGGAALAFGKTVTITIANVEHPIDPQHVADLQRALTTPGALIPPAFTPTASLVITPHDGDPITLDIGPTQVQRRGEPVAIAITAEQHAILLRSAQELVDAERWSEEPSTISTITLDGRVFTRGAVLGEWTLSGKPADAVKLEALATVAAHVRATLRTDQTPTPHHLELVVTPPVGAPITHAIEIGEATSSGCPARIGSELVIAARELCIAVAKLAK